MADLPRSEEHPEPAGVAAPSPLLWLGGGLPPRFRWVSPSLLQALGHPLEAWRTRGFASQLVHPEDLAGVLEAWGAVARTGEPRTLEFRAVSAEGRPVRLSVELNAVEPSPDGTGELLGTVRVLAPPLQPEERERTAPSLEEMIAALTRTQRIHEELIDAIDGIVWETDANFRFTFVSKQAERLLGYPIQKWMEEPDFWLAHLHPEDRDWASAYCLKSAKECRAHEFEYRMVAADGSSVWLRDIVTVVSEDGVLRGLRGIMVDVTAQRRARTDLEQTVSLLRATLESTADGVIVLTQDWHVTAINGRFHKLWNIPDSLLDCRDGRVLSEYMRSQLENAEQVHERTQKLFASPEQEGVDVLELRDGRVLERYSRPQRLGDTIVGRVWTYRDVTVERRAQAESERLLREAREAVRVRDDFLSIASHELKTPLTPLKLHLQVLKHRMASGQPVPAQHVEKALAQVARLSGLINDLLDTSRIQAGRLELRHEPVSLGALTQEVLADLRSISPHRSLDYEEPAEPLLIQGDRGRLAQVLVNLLENALKYSPTGGTIRVRLERDGAQALISVSDSGIGIPPDQKAHLFERFFRARNAPISGFGGLGLGLYICRDIVERHGGRIWVESEVGQGSTFHVTLPVLEDEASEPAAPSATPPETAPHPR
ncbi:PAS domain S-box-containing protein [Archangium gephyra]|uniref:histidine kinase n=1 Tax=Archangium gephyra TaxID=48 RepID=A0AAC8Q5L8_9BACT|nr:ATP-binding protein [Archangium gephyra]AKJ01421.1 Chemotaxis protein methyltransferase CheR [Archangium gephyra]REG34235.1 PAS domain S-box-containing protein [Archangium gephyra]